MRPAKATHNFKWVKNIHICENLRLNICKSWCLNKLFPIAVILPADKTD